MPEEKKKRGFLGRIRKETTPPTQDVMAMQSQGIPEDEIIENLTNEGFGQQQISEAVNQAELKKGVEEPEIPEPPITTEEGISEMQLEPELEELERLAPEPSEESEQLARPIQQTSRQMIPQYPATPQPISSREITEQIEELAESIINEKWEEISSGVGDLSLWRDQVQTEITSIKQEIIRTQKRFDLLQASIIGKITEYGKDISNISVETRAVEKVLQKILQPLTTNVKELSKITSELKTRKK